MNSETGSLLDAKDIRPTALMRNKEWCVKWDRDFLLYLRNEWVEVRCPACDSTETSLSGQKSGFVYVECIKCQTVFTNPRPSSSLLREFYKASKNYEYWSKYIFPATEETRHEHIVKPRVQRVLRYCKDLALSHGTLLEIGAGFGTFCHEMSRQGIFSKVIALEPIPALAEACRSRGLEVIAKPVEEIAETEIADVVVAFEVIEHLFCPRDFIQQCHRLLGAHGLLAITCPNVRGFDIAELSMLSNTFDHEHLNYFNIRSLPMLMERCGFIVKDVQTPGRLDAASVRELALSEEINLKNQPFLRTVLIDRWDELGEPFQNFLSAHCLSSHMWVVAEKSNKE
jgi:2-polyprenyl-3-methyl-5-hydroxy-6-metoxy-1,4-benzoquinol methylase